MDIEGIAGDRSSTRLERTVVRGWQGRFFEDFEVGAVYTHRSGRTVHAQEGSWFALLTQNTAPIHFDEHYAAQTEWGKPLVDPAFTLALVTGQSSSDVSQNAATTLGWDRIRPGTPVFSGDTIYSQSEVLEIRDSHSRADVGIVTVETTGYNQTGAVVIAFQRTLLIYRRGRAPAVSLHS